MTGMGGKRSLVLDKKGSPEGSNLGEPNPSEGSNSVARAKQCCARILGLSIRINPRRSGDGMDGADFSLICEWTFGRVEWFATTSIFSTAKAG